MAAIRIEIDESFCEGVGYCERICPAVFRVDPATGKAVVLSEVVEDPAVIESVEQAETTCPTRAIVISPVAA